MALSKAFILPSAAFCAAIPGAAPALTRCHSPANSVFIGDFPAKLLHFTLRQFAHVIAGMNLNFLKNNQNTYGIRIIFITFAVSKSSKTLNKKQTMDLLSQIVARAKSNKQRIVLPEAEEERTLCAADKALADDIADIILIGNPKKVHALAEEKGLQNIGKATLIDPENYEKSEELAEKLAEIRKSKGMTIEQARELVKNPLYLGCMIIKTEGADGQISGALSTTGDTLRPALQIIKCSPGITCVSGGLLLISKQKQYGEDGVLVVGDVAVTPMPDAAQLSQIAVCTAQTAKSVAGFAEPRVAMLSFSTKGSAKHEVVDKVIEATRLAKELDPTLKIDGELQADAALVPSVGSKKAPGSDIAGKANVLVFPNLEVGNIGYKMVQRLGDAIAIGPILQGIARPVNDLSRGCSVDDIYYMIAITACQAMDANK